MTVLASCQRSRIKHVAQWAILYLLDIQKYKPFQVPFLPIPFLSLDVFVSLFQAPSAMKEK